VTGEVAIRPRAGLARLGSSWRTWLFVFLLLDLAHRILQIAAGPFPLEWDALSYWSLARSLSESGSLLSGDPTAYRVPGYPAFLALFQSTFGAWALEGVVIAQNLLGVATALFVAGAARSLSAVDGAAPLGYALAATSLGRIQYDQMAMSEPLFVALLAAHLWLLARAVGRDAATPWLLAGGLLGVATLVRPIGALLAPAEALALVLAGVGGRRAAGAGRRAAVLLLVGAVLPCAAWIARNAVAVGSPVLLRSGGLVSWEHAFRPQGAALEVPPEALALLPRQIDARNGWEVQAALRALGWDETRRERWMSGVSREAIRGQRGAYLRRLATNVVRFWSVAEEAYPFYLREPSGRHADQKVLYAPRLVQPFSALLRGAYRYPWWGQLVVSLLAILAALRLAIGSARERILGFVALAWTAYFCCATVLLIYPLYRFRMVLDPVGATAVAVCAATLATARRAPRSKVAIASGSGVG